MTLTDVTETITVWTTADGLPTRLVRDGVRYRVTDTPTELRDTIVHPMLTHPLEMVVGWRFQGTADDGTSRVFDVRPRSGSEWELLHLWI